jgi:hypothetical protein
VTNVGVSHVLSVDRKTHNQRKNKSQISGFVLCSVTVDRSLEHDSKIIVTLIDHNVRNNEETKIQT